LQSSPPQ